MKIKKIQQKYIFIISRFFFLLSFFVKPIPCTYTVKKNNIYRVKPLKTIKKNAREAGNRSEEKLGN
jgi:hypothetical protein